MKALVMMSLITGIVKRNAASPGGRKDIIKGSARKKKLPTTIQSIFFCSLFIYFNAMAIYGLILKDSTAKADKAPLPEQFNKVGVEMGIVGVKKNSC